MLDKLVRDELARSTTLSVWLVHESSVLFGTLFFRLWCFWVRCEAVPETGRFLLHKRTASVRKPRCFLVGKRRASVRNFRYRARKKQAYCDY
jgi:hypothetical protein